MSAHSKRFPLLKSEEQSRAENRNRREILQKILADPRFGGWRIDWPEDGKGKMPEGDLNRRQQR